MSSIKSSPPSTTQDVVPGGTSDDFSKSTDHRYGCLVASFDARFKNGFHAEAVAGTERVELTNPGIIERLHQDIHDYLSIHGFRLENNRCKEKSNMSDGGSGMDESSPDVATLFIPRLSYIYDDSENRGECQTMSSTQEGKLFADTTLSRAGAGNDAPLGTLVLHVQEESVLHTVGPLLRTYLRLSSHSINPRRLRAVVNCRFVLKSQQKQLQRNNNRHMQSIETMVANRMAHHIHMIIRNSMGSALCLDLVVVLPFYRTDIDDQLIDEASFDSDICQNRNDVNGSTLVPVSKKAIQIAMDKNRDACYPTVQLVERKDGLDNDFDSCNTSGGRKMTNTENEGIASTLHLNVSTRMCTVRHQPSLFKWVTTLSGQHCSANFEEEVDGCKQSTYTDYPSNTTVDIIHDENNGNGEGPLIVACIEKVANLHRILMLCHDYYDEKKMELDDCLMNNVIVVIPGDDSDAAKDENNNDNDPKINRNREKKGKRNKILSPKMKDEKLMREFEEAIVNFHNVIFRHFNEAGNGDQSNQKNRSMRYRPILVFESRAVEVLSRMLRGRQKAMTPITTSGDSPSKSSTTTSPMQNTLLVGIDLHPKALTLHGGRYCQPHSTIRQQQSKPSENQIQRQASKCRALRMMQRSDAIVFGYESSGIPKALSEVLNGWVEIPSRSSINVVAAMSIALDTLFRG